jgi:ribosomal protein S21
VYWSAGVQTARSHDQQDNAGKEEHRMAYVTATDGESIESLLKRFRSSVMRSGLLREVKERRYFRSKAEKARAAAQRAERKRRRKKAA